MRIGDRASVERTVAEHDTAAALGSGDLAVLSTPRLLAWCEAATCAVVNRSIAPGQTSVGTRVQVEHLVASPVGADVSVIATAAYVDGRLVRFEVVAKQTTDGAEQVVGHGEVTRVVVDRRRFLARLG